MFKKPKGPKGQKDKSKRRVEKTSQGGGRLDPGVFARRLAAGVVLFATKLVSGVLVAEALGLRLRVE